jgi:hypothetical protein
MGMSGAAAWTARWIPSPDRRRLALRSAVAATVCLGGAAGLPFWWAVLVRALPTAMGATLSRLLPAQTLETWWPPILVVGGIGWGWWLGRISGYRPRWRLMAAGAFGLGPGASWLGMSVVHQRVGRTWPALPVHVKAAVLIVLIVGVTAAVTGIALGLAVGSLRAAATLGLVGALGALPAAMVVWGLDLIGLRIGTGDAVMAKVTAPATLAAALCGGTAIGLLLTRFTARMANSSR